MQTPLQVTFHNLDNSDFIEATIRVHTEKLEKYCDSIIKCRVTVDAPHHHHRTGNHFEVRIEVAVPGETLVSHGESGLNLEHSDLYGAIHNAFDVMRRQLEDYGRERRRDVKTHLPAPHGRIVELYPDKDYGKIETNLGHLIYFHRNSVCDADFEGLKLGTHVRFDEEMGERGPQASTVHVIGKHQLND